MVKVSKRTGKDLGRCNISSLRYLVYFSLLAAGAVIGKKINEFAIPDHVTMTMLRYPALCGLSRISVCLLNPVRILCSRTHI